MAYVVRGHRVKDAREKEGLTLAELSTGLKAHFGSDEVRGVSTTHLSNIERGRTQPSIRVLRALAAVLKVPEDYFREETPSIKIGYSLFPDTVLIRQTQKFELSRGRSQFRFEVNFQQVEWDKVLVEVANNNVQIAICNSDDFTQFTAKTDNENKGEGGKNVAYLGDVTVYRGYAILARDQRHIKAYSAIAPRILRDDRSDEANLRKEALKQTLKPLNTQKTLLYIDGDVGSDMERFVRRVFQDLEEEIRFEIVNCQANEGLRKFLQDTEALNPGKPVLYIGGLTQRLIAEGKGAFPVVTVQEASDSLDNDLRVTNGIVVNADFMARNRDAFEIFIDRWNGLVDTLHVDPAPILDDATPHLLKANRDFTEFHFHRVIRNGWVEFRQLSKRVLQGEPPVRIKGA